MLVLRKPGKPDYSNPSAYRGIALLSTISKVLSASVAKVLTYWSEKLSMLPNTQFGGRPGRTTNDAIHTVNTYTKQAWRQKDIVAMLFLDVCATFPSVVIKRLIHDMRMRGVPKSLTDWIKEKLQGRYTTICYDNYTLENYAITNGVDQGCPLLVILYLYYNVDLLDVADPSNGKLAVGFMDDIIFAVRAKNFDIVVMKIQDIWTREAGVKEWLKQHYSTFGLDKFGLLGAAR